MSYILTEEVKSWIQQSVGTKNCIITIENTTQKGEGYVGEFIFAKVELQCSEGTVADSKTLFIALKRNNKNPAVQKQIPEMPELCRREVYFYGVIIPAYQRFHKIKTLQDDFYIVPKCYKAFLEEENNVVVLENLKRKGYVLHQREKPMNIAEVKLCLKAYAKLHALSFAMRDQNPEEFKMISKDLCPLISAAFSNTQPVFDRKSINIVNTLKEAGREDLSVKFERFNAEKGIFKRFVEAADTTSDETVIIHGDCHNANMLFLFKDNDRSNPQHVALIDFQVTCLHSPILDISYFLYINLSSEDLPQFKDFLEFYYNELSSVLTELGSDVKKLFPKNIMHEHLKKFLLYGFCISVAFLEIMYVDNEDAPPLIDEETNELMGGLKDLKIKSRDEYLRRLVSIVDSFFNSGYM
ncbi:unnamed protein product [Diabrotica balteata]|uniref:CHK kinase-like domain-containing protein n=1 Tax=Diabrotica balteata TaxID=107213 RepID=A0A9N9T8M2_DIABA|nr:unnamed protein product [Diabrotica balteata]